LENINNRKSLRQGGKITINWPNTQEPFAAMKMQGSAESKIWMDFNSLGCLDAMPVLSILGLRRCGKTQSAGYQSLGFTKIKFHKALIFY